MISCDPYTPGDLLTFNDTNGFHLWSDIDGRMGTERVPFAAQTQVLMFTGGTEAAGTSQWDRYIRVLSPDVGIGWVRKEFTARANPKKVR